MASVIAATAHNATRLDNGRLDTQYLSPLKEEPATLCT